MMRSVLAAHLLVHVALAVAVGVRVEPIDTQRARHVVLPQQIRSLHQQQSLGAHHDGEYEQDAKAENHADHPQKVHRLANQAGVSFRLPQICTVPAVRPLTRQSSIAVAAPASAPLDPAHAKAGLEALKKRGLAVELVRPMSPEPQGYLAGDDEARADELNILFGRNDIDAIFCLRGGYGSLRILDQLGYDALLANPKLIVGYSDITALQLAVFANTGIPSLSGPMVAPDWPKIDETSERQFWTLAKGTTPFEIIGPYGETLDGMNSGSVEGVLIGGNLTMICSLLGTQYLPDLSGAILFVEDVGEKPYQIDRLLARMRLAGVLEILGGLVFGAFTHAAPGKGRPSLPLDHVLAHYAGFVPGPVARGLVYGHFTDKCTLPVGIKASLEVNGQLASLTVTESIARDV